MEIFIVLTMDNEIQKGDLVEYIDRGVLKEGKSFKSINISKQGIWDGEKVILRDKEQTTVRKKSWLTLIEKGLDWSCKFNENNINSLIFYDNTEKKKTVIAIPSGKNRIDILSFEKYSTFKLKTFEGYMYDFNGIIIVSTHTCRQVIHRGTIIAESKF